MAFAALICWFATAFVGLYLVAVWLIENDVNQEGNVASRLPGPVILTHVLLALTGFVFWVIHLIFGSPGGAGQRWQLWGGSRCLARRCSPGGSRSTPRL